MCLSESCNDREYVGSFLVTHLPLVAVDQHRVISPIQHYLERSGHFASDDLDLSLVGRDVYSEVLDAMLRYEFLIDIWDGLGDEGAEVCQSGWVAAGWDANSMVFRRKLLRNRKFSADG